MAAALEAWAAFGPAHPDPAAEYQQRRPPPPKVNTLFNYLKKAPGSSGGSAGKSGGAQAAGGSSSGAGQPALAAGSDVTAAQQQQQQRRQQQQQQQQPAAAVGAGSATVPGSARGSGAEASRVAAPKVDAFQLLMHPPKPGGAAGVGSPAAVAAGAAAAAAAGGSGGRRSRHTWSAVGPFANSLVAIAANPERCARDVGALECGCWPRVVLVDPKSSHACCLLNHPSPAAQEMTGVNARLCRSCRREQPQLWFDDRCVWIADKFAKARRLLLAGA